MSDDQQAAPAIDAIKGGTVPDAADIASHNAALVPPEKSSAGPEVGGRGGLEPTRYGDWEKNGRCIDF